MRYHREEIYMHFEFAYNIMETPEESCHVFALNCKYRSNNQNKNTEPKPTSVILTPETSNIIYSQENSSRRYTCRWKTIYFTSAVVDRRRRRCRCRVATPRHVSTPHSWRALKLILNLFSILTRPPTRHRPATVATQRPTYGYCLTILCCYNPLQALASLHLVQNMIIHHTILLWSSSTLSDVPQF